MAWIKKLLVPNRYDFLYLVLGTLCFAAIVTPFAAHHGNHPVIPVSGVALLFAGVSGCFLAIGAVVALGRQSWRRVGIVAAFGALLPPSALLGYYWLGENQTTLNCVLPPFFNNPEPDPDPVDIVFLGKMYLALMFAPLGSWLAIFLVSRLPQRIKEISTNRLRLTRTRFLVGLASVMLLLGLTNNILHATVPGYGEVFLNIVGGVIGTLFTVIALIAVVYLPTVFLVGQRSAWLKAIISIAALTALSFFMWFVLLRVPWANPSDFLSVIATLFGACLYLLSLVSVLDPSRQLSNVAAESSPIDVSSAKVKYLPSAWSFALLLILGGLIWLPFQYDLTVLARGGGWKKARMESALRWKSRGQIRRSFEWGVEVLHCEFDDTTDPDVLELLDGDPCSIFVFAKLSPQVDFSKLEKKASPLAAHFDSGEVTTKQLNDFLSQPASFVRFAGCEAIDTGQKIDPASIVQLYFVKRFDRDAKGGPPRLGQNHPVHLKETLAAFASFENVKSILIQLDPTPEDWPQIVRASQTTSVRIMGKLPENLSKEQMTLANENIALAGNLILYTQDTLTLDQKNWLENSSMVFDMYWDEATGNPQIFRDLVFAYPHRFRIGFAIPFTRNFNFRISGEPSHFIFDRDAKGNPTGLYLPFGESNPRVEPLTELKVLSFDECWIQRRSTSAERNVVDLSRLTKLEHLAFSANSSFVRIDFLANLKSLKHLQIPTVDRSSQPGPGFDSCPSLETITMLGKPDDKSIMEFQRLPNLKKLTIVDVYEEFVDPKTTATQDETNTPGLQVKSEFLELLAKKLPNVEVSIVTDKGFSPLLPDSFKRFLNEKRKQLRQKLLKESAVEANE